VVISKQHGGRQVLNDADYDTLKAVSKLSEKSTGEIYSVVRLSEVVVKPKQKTLTEKLLDFIGL
jgi:hypothetical protein